jgi:membrane protein YqaA with SNARE-associated domain
MRALSQVSRHLGKPWYPVAVAGLAFLDVFLLAIPTDAFLVSAVAVNRRRWWLTALTIALGSAAGALLFTYLAFTQLPWLELHFPAITAAKSRLPAVLLLFRDYAGFTVLFGAAGPLPMHPFILGAALYGMPVGEVALLVLAGRAGKYLVFAWCTAYVPSALSYLGRLREEIRRLRHQRVLRKR